MRYSLTMELVLKRGIILFDCLLITKSIAIHLSYSWKKYIFVLSLELCSLVRHPPVHFAFLCGCSRATPTQNRLNLPVAPSHYPQESD